ncbi:MAG: NFACT family protein [Clostridiales bacterium]|nr:NFACT family protein [Clostridiales bacterium]
MAFDAFYLTAVLGEVRERCDGAKVEKIYQPSRDTLIFQLRGQKSREKLLIAANPTAPRLHLTAASPENPPEPPMFCMFLRKHLLGARLSEISQTPMERCAVFSFDCTDEMGYPIQKKLVAELMGRTCNVYLLGPEGRILDCLRRIGLDESSRPALPGLSYQNPSPVEKRNPAEMTQEDYVNLLTAEGADILSQRLMDALGGLSPLVTREAALFAAGDTDARVSALDADRTGEKLYLFFEEHLRHPAPWYYAAPDGTLKQFAFCPIREYGDCARAESFSGLLDRFYTLRDRKDAMRQKSQSLRKSVTNQVQRLRRKMALQEKELTATYDRERLRQLGDILTANLHRIQKGQTKILCQDFYDENMGDVEIPLSPILSPQQNAAKFYKDYTRMKNAQKELTHQLELGTEECSYLESVLEELGRAQSEAELEEIRQELYAGGYVRMDGAKKKMKQSKLPPMRFESTDGFPIYVGRNNRQNDELTFKLARKDDVWCHASKVHGSHVIISCGGQKPPDDTVTQAAQLAAYYAETGGGQNIPVDVTTVKQVKKTPGGKPGMVIYHTYRTAIVNPYPDIRVDPLNAEQK